MSILYPECPKNFEYKETCKVYHENQKDCKITFLENVGISFKKIFKLYFKFYGFQAIIELLLKRKNVDKILFNYIINVSKSSLYLGTTTNVTRLFTCVFNDFFGNGLTKKKLFFAALLGSTFTFIERHSRLHQITNMYLYYLLLGNLKNANEKYKNVIGILPLFALLSNLIKDSGKIKMKNLIISSVTAQLL
jgi:hypothetical protein